MKRKSSITLAFILVVTMLLSMVAYAVPTSFILEGDDGKLYRYSVFDMIDNDDLYDAFVTEMAKVMGSDTKQMFVEDTNLETGASKVIEFDFAGEFENFEDRLENTPGETNFTPNYDVTWDETTGSTKETEVVPPSGPTPADEAEAFTNTYGDLLALDPTDADDLAETTLAEVNTAITAYTALSDEAKALLDADTAAKLGALKAALEAEATPQELAEAFTTQYEDVLTLTVATVAIADKTDVGAAKAAFDLLDTAVQDLLEDEGILLENLLAKIAELEEAAAFTNTYGDLLALDPTDADDLANTTLEEVNAAIGAYNALSAGAKALVDADADDDVATTLGALKAALEAEATPQELAEAFTTQYEDVLALTVATVAVADKTDVEAAKAAFDALDAAVKALLADEGTLLTNLLAKIAELEGGSGTETGITKVAITASYKVVVTLNPAVPGLGIDDFTVKVGTTLAGAADTDVLDVKTTDNGATYTLTLTPGATISASDYVIVSCGESSGSAKYSDTVTIASGFVDGLAIGAGPAHEVEIAKSAPTTLELIITLNDADAVAHYVKAESKPADKSGYTETFTVDGADRTTTLSNIASGDKIFIHVAAPDNVTEAEYSITITKAQFESAVTSINSGTLAGSVIDATGGSSSGTGSSFSAAASISAATAASDGVSVSKNSATNAELVIITDDDTKYASAIKWVKVGATDDEPKNSAAFTNSLTQNDNNNFVGVIPGTLETGDIIYVEVTAEDGDTKGYFCIEVTTVAMMTAATNVTLSAASANDNTITVDGGPTRAVPPAVAAALSTLSVANFRFDFADGGYITKVTTVGTATEALDGDWTGTADADGAKAPIFANNVVASDAATLTIASGSKLGAISRGAESAGRMIVSFAADTTAATSIDSITLAPVAAGATAVNGDTLSFHSITGANVANLTIGSITAPANTLILLPGDNDAKPTANTKPVYEAMSAKLSGLAATIAGYDNNGTGIVSEATPIVYNLPTEAVTVNSVANGAVIHSTSKKFFFAPDAVVTAVAADNSSLQFTFDADGYITKIISAGGALTQDYTATNTGGTKSPVEAAGAVAINNGAKVGDVTTDGVSARTITIGDATSAIVIGDVTLKAGDTLDVKGVTAANIGKLTIGSVTAEAAANLVVAQTNNAGGVDNAYAQFMKFCSNAVVPTNVTVKTNSDNFVYTPQNGMVTIPAASASTSTPGTVSAVSVVKYDSAKFFFAPKGIGSGLASDFSNSYNTKQSFLFAAPGTDGISVLDTILVTGTGATIAGVYSAANNGGVVPNVVVKNLADNNTVASFAALTISGTVGNISIPNRATNASSFDLTISGTTGNVDLTKLDITGTRALTIDCTGAAKVGTITLPTGTNRITASDRLAVTGPTSGVKLVGNISGATFNVAGNVNTNDLIGGNAPSLETGSVVELEIGSIATIAAAATATVNGIKYSPVNGDVKVEIKSATYQEAKLQASLDAITIDASAATKAMTVKTTDNSSAGNVANTLVGGKSESTMLTFKENETTNKTLTVNGGYVDFTQAVSSNATAEITTAVAPSVIKAASTQKIAIGAAVAPCTINGLKVTSGGDSANIVVTVVSATELSTANANNTNTTLDASNLTAPMTFNFTNYGYPVTIIGNNTHLLTIKGTAIGASGKEITISGGKVDLTDVTTTIDTATYLVINAGSDVELNAEKVTKLTITGAADAFMDSDDAEAATAGPKTDDSTYISVSATGSAFTIANGSVDGTAVFYVANKTSGSGFALMGTITVVRSGNVISGITVVTP